MLKQNRLLIAGDVLALAIVTIIGFATHGETGMSFLPRMSAMFFPLAGAWLIFAPFLGLFQQEITSNPKQFWRSVLVMIYAASLAVVIRGLILNTAIIPIFAVVLTATSALGMLVWRIIYFFLDRKISKVR